MHRPGWETVPTSSLRVSRSVINSRRIRKVQKHFDSKYVLLLTDKKATRITTGSAYAEAVRGLLEL
jgi:two-component system, LytTR family, response regulator